MADQTHSTLTLHAGCVALGNSAALITGASGSGKSTLALELLAYGAVLVADDRTQLCREDGRLVARAPQAIRGQIEARGVGILTASVSDSATVTLIVDLDHVEETRLPPRRSKTYIGVNLPLIYRTNEPAFAAVVLQFLKAGRSA